MSDSLLRAGWSKAKSVVARGRTLPPVRGGLPVLVAEPASLRAGDDPCPLEAGGDVRAVDPLEPTGDCADGPQCATGGVCAADSLFVADSGVRAFEGFAGEEITVAFAEGSSGADVTASDPSAEASTGVDDGWYCMVSSGAAETAAARGGSDSSETASLSPARGASLSGAVTSGSDATKSRASRGSRVPATVQDNAGTAEGVSVLLTGKPCCPSSSRSYDGIFPMLPSLDLYLSQIFLPLLW